MNLDELVPAPNAQKVNKLAKRVFGYSLDLENMTESKAKRLHKNLSTQMSLYESQLGSQAQKRTKYYEMKLALEALSKHINERMVDEEEVEENAFNTAREKAIADGKNSFNFNGKNYPITDKGKDDEERAKKRFGESEDIQVNEGAESLDQFRDLYRKGIGSDDAAVTLRELIQAINDDALWSDEYPQLKQFVDVSSASGSKIVTAKKIPGDSADEKITALVQAIDDDKWVDDIANNLMRSYSMGAEAVGESKVVKEGAVETSELVMAAKSMVDKYDQMIKDLSEMANEDLAPVADKVRDEMGSDVADNFTQQMTQALESTLAVMKADRATAETATRVLVGDQPAEPMGDDPIIPDEPDMEPTVDQDADDDFAAADAAMGGAEAEVGREKRD